MRGLTEPMSRCERRRKASRAELKDAQQGHGRLAEAARASRQRGAAAVKASEVLARSWKHASEALESARRRGEERTR